MAGSEIILFHEKSSILLVSLKVFALSEMMILGMALLATNSQSESKNSSFERFLTISK